MLPRSCINKRLNSTETNKKKTIHTDLLQYTPTTIMYPSLFIVIILLSIVIRYDAQAFTTPPRTTTIIQCISSSYYHHTDVVSSRRKNEFHNFVQLYSANTDEEVTTIIQQNGDGASSSAIENQVVLYTAGMPTLTQLIVDDTTNESTISEEDAEQSYRRGLATIGFITLLFASNSPTLHSAFAFTTTAPPVLLINALVTVVGKSLESFLLVCSLII